ncbi:MAG TPA: hypothetical protein VLP43_08530 [Solirubrobacteraceae bacterium]|nr:hypothetical protein [Solirubrobacteraceae bacterium]
MKLRTTAEGLIAHDPQRGRWVRVADVPDLLAFLAEGQPARERASAAIATDDAVVADPSAAGLPFRPRSIRAFMLWEQHVIDSSRMLVKKFYPRRAAKVVLGFERLTGKPFPKLKPNARFRPVGIHLRLASDLGMGRIAHSGPRLCVSRRRLPGSQRHSPQSCG